MQQVQQAAGGLGPIAGGVGCAEAEPQGTQGVLGCLAPQGQQHMGRMGAAGIVTGRAGGYADSRQIQPVGHVLAVLAGQAHADQTGQAIGRAVEAGGRPTLPQGAAEISRQRPFGRGVLGPVLTGILQRRSQAHNQGHRFGAGAQPPLLVAAAKQRAQLAGLAGIQKADALGPAEFVGRRRKQRKPLSWAQTGSSTVRRKTLSRRFCP